MPQESESTSPVSTSLKNHLRGSLYATCVGCFGVYVLTGGWVYIVFGLSSFEGCYPAGRQPYIAACYPPTPPPAYHSGSAFSAVSPCLWRQTFYFLRSTLFRDCGLHLLYIVIASESKNE